MAGNLVPVTKSGEQLHLIFHAFRENRLPFLGRLKVSVYDRPYTVGAMFRVEKTDYPFLSDLR